MGYDTIYNTIAITMRDNHICSCTNTIAITMRDNHICSCTNTNAASISCTDKNNYQSIINSIKIKRTGSVSYKFCQNNIN